MVQSYGLFVAGFGLFIGIGLWLAVPSLRADEKPFVQGALGLSIVLLFIGQWFELLHIGLVGLLLAAVFGAIEVLLLLAMLARKNK